MTTLLSAEQLAARARSRREGISYQQSDRTASTWPITVEGWSGERQVFGFGLRDSTDLGGAVLLARSALNADTVVVFSDSRVFSPDMNDPADRRTLQRVQRGEVSLVDLATQGHPRVIEQMTIVPFNVERGITGVQMIRYLTRYTFGRETGIIWDIDTSGAAPFADTFAGAVPDALTWGMQEYGLDIDNQPFRSTAGGVLMWEHLDTALLNGVAAALKSLSHGHFVILNADPKIAEAAGLAPGSTPRRVAMGNRDPDVVAQLVARELKS